MAYFKIFCWTQILVATSTLAWGVNTPAHLVVIKGTEYFDAPTRQAPGPLLARILLCPEASAQQIDVAAGCETITWHG